MDGEPSTSYRVGYRGRLEPTLDFAEGHSLRLSSPIYGRATLNSEPKAYYCQVMCHALVRNV